MLGQFAKCCAALAIGVTATFAATQRANADILPGSIWPNGNLENASASPNQLNSPSMSNTPGGPGTWRRGGGDFTDPGANPGPYTFDKWDASHGTVSGTHALVLDDNVVGGNGEWFVPDFNFPANELDKTDPVPVPSGATIRVRFFWNYDTHIPAGSPDGADMRVTIRGDDGISGFGLGNAFDFLANGSTGGQFVEADFIRTLPAGVTGIRMNIASGGSGDVTGYLAVDDISVVVVPEPASAVALIGAAGLLVRRRRA